MRAEWQFWRHTAPKYGFGRTELLPIRKTAAGIAKYVGKYVAKHIGQRLPEDKGARLVRYSRHARRAGTRFAWVTEGARMWRLKLRALCQRLGLTEENCQERLKTWYGRNWIYVLWPVIESIKLRPFYDEAEARASLEAAWLVAMEERERRRPRKRSHGRRRLRPGLAPERHPPGSGRERPWASWIERSLKEDGG